MAAETEEPREKVARQARARPREVGPRAQSRPEAEDRLQRGLRANA